MPQPVILSVMGQEVIVKEGSGTAVSNGTGSISDLDTNDFISFSIDFADTELLNGDTIALHWGMTCGNDAIEGAYTVTEPAILGLALGLIRISVSKRKDA